MCRPTPRCATHLQRKSVSDSKVEELTWFFYLLPLAFILVKLWLNSRKKPAPKPVAVVKSPPRAPTHKVEEKMAPMKHQVEPPIVVKRQKTRSFLKRAIIAKEILERRF